jgi:hypothetical protein
VYKVKRMVLGKYIAMGGVMVLSEKEYMQILQQGCFEKNLYSIGLIWCGKKGQGIRLVFMF